MGSADFKIVRPVGVTADGAFSRASPKNVWDATGMLVQVPANVLAMSYDPSDLTAAPKPSIEAAATNLFLSSAAFGPTSAWYNNGSTTVLENAALAPDGTMGADIVTNTVNVGSFLNQEIGALQNGTTYTRSAFGQAIVGKSLLVFEWVDNGGYGYASFDLVAGTCVVQNVSASQVNMQDVGNGWYRCIHTFTINGGGYDNRIEGLYINGIGPSSSTGSFALWQTQFEVGATATSPIFTTSAQVTRAADVFAPALGLSYSNVAIAEPTYSSTATYAANALVYDPTTRLTYLSLIDANKGKLLTDKTSWVPQLATNRWRVFDKAVNSQTSAPNLLVMAVNAGALVNTMGMLNVDGSRVTVTQPDSGYSKSKSLVRHEVLSWYDWFYEEPIREGDVIFDDIPPYAQSPLIITVENPGDTAAIGCLCMGKARTIGQTMWDFAGGVLSYSTSNTDTFGNITLVKRPNSKTLNFDVYIQPGFESVVYSWMEDYTDVELFIIGAESYSMTYSYGYLGQWSIPVSNTAKTASIEFKGLV